MRDVKGVILRIEIFVRFVGIVFLCYLMIRVMGGMSVRLDGIMIKKRIIARNVGRIVWIAMGVKIIVVRVI